MTEVRVIDREVSAFDRIRMSPDARRDVNDGRLVAVEPADADRVEYVVALYNYDDETATVDLPAGAIVLEAGEGVLTVAVPSRHYGSGGDE